MELPKELPIAMKEGKIVWYLYSRLLSFVAFEVRGPRGGVKAWGNIPRASLPSLIAFLQEALPKGGGEE